MKIRINEYFGELPEYFTLNRAYDVKSKGYTGFWVISDKLQEEYVLSEGCAHLNGGSWEIVSEHSD